MERLERTFRSCRSTARRRRPRLCRQTLPLGFAVLYAPAYQSEHKSALSADWAHLPVPKDRDLFNRLVEKGEQVTRLLDANSDARDVAEAVLGRERAAALGPLKRAEGRQSSPR